MESEWNITLRMPPAARGWRVTVLVSDAATDQLKATDEGNLMSLTGQTKLVSRLVKQLMLDEEKAEAFGREVDRAWLTFYQEYQKSAAAGPAQESAAQLLEEMPAEIRLEAEDLLRDPRLTDAIRDDLAALGIAGERELSLTLYLVGVSRQLPKPLSSRVHGPTSSGKSFVAETVSDCFPPETVIHATQITPQAFFHMEPDSLRHKFIVAGERSRMEDDEAAEKTRALRELQATGKLSKLISMKGPRGQYVTKHIEQEGPIAYVETTSAAKVFEEDANRCLTLFTDERPDQTKNIIQKLAAGYGGADTPADRDRIIQRHHALQRLLQPTPVVIPYAERLGQLLNYQRVELRRGFPQIMSLVQAVTLLHQRQRERDDQGRLVATPADYQIAQHLLMKPMARLLGGGLSDPALRFFERLSQRVTGPFNTTEAWKAETYSREAVRGWLGELYEAGLVKVVSESRGRAPTVWELTGNDPEMCQVLPTMEQVFGLDWDFAHGCNP
jgi:hypothetical protein